MKEVAPHIANAALQKKAASLFQRSAEEAKEDNAFFSNVQEKLTVGAKDDPFEKEADAMADKVVNRSADESAATNSDKEGLQRNAADTAHTFLKVQTKCETCKAEEEKKEEPGEEDKQGAVQRMYREQDEGMKIFRSADGSTGGMSKREAVIATAKTMLGKIKAKQPGAGGQRVGADQLWEIFKLAAPGVWDEDTVKTFGKPFPSWCGIFSVWAHKKAGINLGNWQMGRGVSAFGTLKPTTSPQPGDIGYIDQPYQHHCIVTKVNGNSVDSIDGNSGLFSEVIENTRPLTAYSGFFTAFSGSDGGKVSKKENGDEQVQAKESSEAPPSVEASLASSRGSGNPLPGNTKTEMEGGFGIDFSGVKIHNDSNAAQMSKQLNAHAFTHGNDIYFNENKFNPATDDGRHLLAHELTHTIQQGASVQKKDIVQKQQAPAIQKDGPTVDELKTQLARQGVVLTDDEVNQIHDRFPAGMTLQQQELALQVNGRSYSAIARMPAYTVRPVTQAPSTVDLFIFHIDKGRSILVSSPVGGSILMDAGSGTSSTSNSQNARDLAAHLNNVLLSGLAPAPQSIRISHTDADHFNAVSAALSLPQLGNTTVEVTRQQISGATGNRNWTTMNIQLAATQSIVQLDIQGQGVNVRKSVIGNMEITEFRSVDQQRNAANPGSAPQQPGGAAFNKNNTSPVTVVRDMVANTTHILTGDAEGRLLNDVVNMVGEEAFRRIIGGSSRSLASVEFPHHGGSVSGPDVSGMVRFLRLCYESSDGSVNFFAQTSQTFSNRQSAAVNYLDVAEVEVQRVMGDPASTPGNSRVTRVQGNAVQELVLSAGTLQQVITQTPNLASRVQQAYVMRHRLISISEQIEPVQQTLSITGETTAALSNAVATSKADVDRMRTTLDTQLGNFWTQLTASARSQGMRGNTPTAQVQTELTNLQTTMAGINPAAVENSLNELINGMNASGRLFMNLMAMTNALRQGQTGRLNELKAEQTQLLNLARGSLGTGVYDQHVRAAWAETREIWTGRVLRVAGQRIGNAEAQRRMMTDYRSILGESVARQMQLNELMQRASEGTLRGEVDPGTGQPRPVPMGTRVGAGIMAALEIIRIGLEVAVAWEQAAEARAQSDAAAAVQGIREIAWWQSFGVAPSIKLVKRGWFSGRYSVVDTGNTDPYRIIRHEVAENAPEYEKAVVSGVTDADLALVIGQLNIQLTTTEQWISRMGHPDNNDSATVNNSNIWLVRINGSWKVKLWSAEEGEYQLSSFASIQEPLNNLWTHLQTNQSNDLAREREQRGTSTIKDTAFWWFAADRIAYAYNAYGNPVQIDFDSFQATFTEVAVTEFAPSIRGRMKHVKAADPETYARLSRYYWVEDTGVQVADSSGTHSQMAFHPNGLGYAYVDASNLVQQTQPAAPPAAAQPKLEVGAPDDPDEREADEMADKVVQRSADEEKQDAVQRKCTDCEQQEEMVQKYDKSADERNGMPGAAAIENDLASSKGAGEALDDGTRTEMEKGFNADFSSIRIHTDTAAGEMSKAIHAHAFTHGRDIYFNSGKYQPDSGPGKKLLAHELTHTIQQGAAPANGSSTGIAVNKKDLSNVLQANPEKSEEVLASPQATALFKAGLQEQLNTAANAAAVKGSTPDFETALHAVVNAVFPVDAIKTAIGLTWDIAYLETEDMAGNTVTLAETIKGIYDLSAKADEKDATGDNYPEAINFIYRVLVMDMANYLMGALQNATPDITARSAFAYTRLEHDLDKGADMLRNPVTFLSVELEGILSLLAGARYEYAVAADDDGRKAAGNKIGQYSRQAIFLNDKIETIKFLGMNQSSLTPLDAAVLSQLDTIREARNAAATEKSFINEYGDDLDLLALHPVTVEEPLAPNKLEPDEDDPDDATLPSSANAVIAPDEALPVTTDDASNKFMSDLNSRLNDQQQAAIEAKKKVIPAESERTYELDEFAAVYTRWYSFFSHEQEKQDPFYRMLAGTFMGSPDMAQGKGIYQMAGMDMYNPFSNAEGAFVRMMLMDFAMDELPNHMGSASSQFSKDLQKNPVKRTDKGVDGTASSPDYQYGQFFKKPGGGGLSGWAEQRDKQVFDEYIRQLEAQKFSEVAKEKPKDQPQKAEDVGITPKGDQLPLVGMKDTKAQEGWNYLIDVYSPDIINPQPIMRERKAIPPEVVAYLLSRKQLYGTVSAKHVPKSPDGKPLGDSGIRKDGVEGGKGNNAAKYVDGEANPDNSYQSRDLKRTIDRIRPAYSARSAGDFDKQMVNTLINDLEAYIETFYHKHAEPEYRVASVLVIANIEFGLAENVKDMLSPGHIAEVMALAFAIAAGTTLLSALGPIGSIVSQGIHAYMNAQGVTGLSAATGLATFLKLSSERADGMNRARAWAVGALVAFGDAQELFEMLISSPASFGGKAGVDKLLKHISEAPPSTTKQMADMCKDLVKDPTARAAMKEGINQRLAELEAKGINDSSPNDEYKSLKAFGEYLGIVEKVAGSKSKKTEDVPLAGAEPPPRMADVFVVRSKAETEALKAAIPPDLQGKVDIIPNSTLEGTTVKVYYKDGKMRMEVGNRAEARHISDHIPTVREMRKYEGFLGSFRRLVDKVATYLKLYPGFGTRGKEIQQELGKLERIVNERIERLNNDEKLASDPVEREAVLREIDDLNRQYLEYMQEVDSYDPAKGFIAATDNVSAGESMRIKAGQPEAQPGYYWRRSRTGELELVNRDAAPIKRGKEEFVLKYDKDTNKVIEVNVKDLGRTYDEPNFSATDWPGAYKELVGPKGDSSFGIFIKKMNTLFGIGVDDVVRQMQLTERGAPRGKNPQDLTIRTVRHSTKQYYIENHVLPYLTARDSITETKAYKDLVKAKRSPDDAYREVSHQRMLEFTKDLDSADKGNIAESWYDAVYAKPGAKHVEVTAAQMKKQGVETSDRFLDRVEGSNAVELKNVADTLGPRDKAEFDDHVLMIGKQVMVDGKPVTLKKLTWVMLDPNGGFKNRTWMADQLKEVKGLSFIIFNSKGESMVLTRSNMAILKDEAKLKAWLGV